ncbi:hypothetical protein PV10_03984 [Exophiala mesophila]|uniref:FAD dependent oxidoreductase domain-containing protein n=1 Tax=Exophiala mesophila TaxID=212818 RepID=A0A0D1ZDD4_EXOME|nr:uncharacterized protein PV10_03984 [Exophiala mesophila]KIV92712.1 hypothetical protein PV10_03984 [Exophiala mesophila]
MASLPSTEKHEFVVLGAGIAGLTTALELKQIYPNSQVTVVAKHFPGSASMTEYTSPWAGANWHTFEPTYNKYAKYDEVTFGRFTKLAKQSPECGIKPCPLRLIYDSEEDIKQNPWYADLVGGISKVPKSELPLGAGAGVDMVTFMINTVVYLSWLQNQLLQLKAILKRKPYTHIDSVLDDFPQATAVFNCTGLGARLLGGVADELVYPTKGQTLLVAEPAQPLQRMYIRISGRWGNEFAHVFPRPLGGGVIIGGTRRDDDWTAEPDMQLAERIKQRCCEIAPELGQPKDLLVISHNVGLRPSRKGGARVELERHHGRILVHNYGAGGAGYQSSWGMAAGAIKLLQEHLASKPRL